MPSSSFATRVGLFGIGLEAYWAQFAGLEERLIHNTRRVAERLGAMDVEVVNLGLIDSPEKARAAGHRFRQADVDLIFLYVTTYALSSTVLPVVRRARVPVIVLNLAPAQAIDYGAFNSLVRPHPDDRRVAGLLPGLPRPRNRQRVPTLPHSFPPGDRHARDDPAAWNEIAEWVAAARVATVMEHNRIGVMGHYYGGMLDIYSDLTLQSATFGGHIEFIEVDELAALRAAASDAEIARRLDAVPRGIRCSARLSTRGIASRCPHIGGAGPSWWKLTGLPRSPISTAALPVPPNEDAISSIILGNSLLTARGIPVAGELEIKNVQAMKIMDAFGAGGSFTEFYAMDYHDDVVLMGHDGPGHIAISERQDQGPSAFRVSRQGGPRSVRGDVREARSRDHAFGIESSGGKLELLVAEGESVAGPILEIGNTNSRYRFPIGARRFVAEWSRHGPAHHCAAGVGHVSGKLAKLASLLGIEYTRVC